MNISLVPADLVDTEFRNPANIGSIYLIIIKNNSVFPPTIKKTFNELIASNDAYIHFKYFAGGINFPELGGLDLDVIFPEQYCNQETEKIDVYKINFDRDNVEMIQLIQSFVISELQKISDRK
jgi:hypothetical protein